MHARSSQSHGNGIDLVKRNVRLSKEDGAAGIAFFQF